MTTRRRDPGGSWWWAGGGGESSLSTENERHLRELPADQIQEVAAAQSQQEVDSDIFQLSYPRPRLRWTAELHDQFVKAVDQLGGANKATPKSILNLMGVQGLTLFHLKSHLQKFRLGKTGRRLWRKEFIPANYYRKRDDKLPPTNLEAQAPNSLSTAYFDRNGSNRIGAETYGNLHLLVEPQAAVENLEATNKINTAAAASAATAGVKMEEEFGGAKPALLPLFPACGTMNYYSPEWSEYLGGGGRRSVGPRPLENPPMDDDYLNSLGYSSSEFAPDSCRTSTIFGTFFDEVDSFSKVHDDAVHDPNVGEHLSSGVGHYYP